MEDYKQAALTLFPTDWFETDTIHGAFKFDNNAAKRAVAEEPGQKDVVNKNSADDQCECFHVSYPLLGSKPSDHVYHTQHQAERNERPRSFLQEI